MSPVLLIGTGKECKPQKSGDSFAVLKLTLSSQTVPKLSPNPILFGLRNDASILYMAASEAFPCLGDLCDATVSVTPGGTISCELPFAIPSGTSGKELAYDDSQGHATVATVPPAMQSQPPCSTYDSKGAACQNCFVNQQFAKPCMPAHDQWYYWCMGITGCEGGGNGFSCQTRDKCATKDECLIGFDAWEACIASACASSCL